MGNMSSSSPPAGQPRSPSSRGPRADGSRRRAFSSVCKNRPRSRGNGEMAGNLLILYEAPALALQLLLDGILIGAIFALAAYGMALVWGVMNIVNIAQGEFVMLGGYVAFFLYQAGIHPLFGIPLAAVALFVFGWALYQTILYRVVDKDLFISLLATFGLSIL